MRTIAIAALACLALAACDDDKREGEPKRPTRLVCTNDAGAIVHDDFATGDMDVTATDGAFVYVSATQEGYVRVSGQCVTYPQTRAPGWKPVIQGLPG